MDKFLLKVNRAKVQSICLRTEKAKLMKENIQLKNYIKRYLTDLALKGKDRPLSMRIRMEAPRVDTKALYVFFCHFRITWQLSFMLGFRLVFPLTATSPVTQARKKCRNAFVSTAV